MPVCTGNYPEGATLYLTRGLDFAQSPMGGAWADAFWLCPVPPAPPVCYFRFTPGRFAWLLANHAAVKAAVAQLEAKAAAGPPEAERGAVEANLSRLRAKLERDTPRLRELKAWYTAHTPGAGLAGVTPEEPPLPPVVPMPTAAAPAAVGGVAVAVPAPVPVVAAAPRPPNHPEPQPSSPASLGGSASHRSRWRAPAPPPGADTAEVLAWAASATALPAAAASAQPVTLWPWLQVPDLPSWQRARLVEATAGDAAAVARLRRLRKVLAA